MSTSENGPKHASVALPDDAAFRLLVESVRDYAIFILDKTGRVVSWSDGARAIKGYTRDEILGSHFSRFYPQEQIDRGWPEYELEQAAAVGRFEDENWRVRKDGSLFWANVVITALRNEKGELIGFSKVTRDLTERRQQTAALRQSEERFRTLVENVRDYAIFLLDKDGFVSTWNEGARQVKGYEAHEIIGSHVSRFYTPEDLKRGWPQQELRIATLEGRFEDEGWRLRKDGSRFWANVVITALRDRTGTLIGFSKITRDLTERRRHEQALAESEERFRLLVEGVRDYAIVMLDTQGFVSSWNSGAERITGYRPVEVIGRHFSHFYTSEAVAANDPWRHLIAAAQPGGLTDEGWRVRRDRTHFWAGSVISTLNDAEGRQRGFVLVIQDLTQRRHAESLADMTVRMHEFIAMLAHELRNPLAPIRNAVELMGRRGLGDPTLESMRQMVERQTTHLTRIVDDLLDVNRIAHGRLAIAKEGVDLTDVLLRAVETSRPLIDSRGHKLHLDIPSFPVELEGDGVRLTQVMINLLNNAAKYTPRGGEIWLEAGQRDADVQIRVRDTGRGIARQDLERVFDLFAQLTPDSNGTQGGLGVGLALVRRVVELHGGTVRATSEGVGQGSEFIVRLPLAAAPGLRVVAERPRSNRAPLPRMRVLVVDDNRDAADSFHFLLEEMGQDVYTVYDGPTALAAAERLRPAVVMLDIGMPGMSGYEVAPELKSRLGGDAPVIVAVTGWGQESDRKQARESLIDHHFAKPVDQAGLHRLLAKIAAERKLGG
ncbi:MAG TPA: PAS domain S-box protein [Gammaproteobacteria bacterium]|nr:PAS domain S-box protein [Gammaproteobacteria bacterium]